MTHETRAAAGAPLLPDRYADAAGAHDELLAAGDGGRDGIRDHWRSLFGAFQQLGGGELEKRRQEARRLFRETGVGYGAATDEAGLRPWQLDPVPFLIPADDWARIEAGLRQRARLMDAILRDLYGPRHLVRGGLVPPELIFRHGGFLLPADGSLAGLDHALTLYAADVVRGIDGRFRVVSDRTQAPAGAGLALETRIASSRILPRLIRASHVHRLARFFRLLRDHLAGRAPHQKLDPRIVFLGQGASDPSSFDHAFLASYLGFPLVEGADLTVRDGHLWLRTIEGLKLVDLLVRRLPDSLCDPLELDAASRAGVPGLLEVCRARNVEVVNPLGSGILENPALIPWLPRIARQFLGEELQLESLPTWWCGEKDGREHVLANLERLVLKPIDRAQGAIWGGELDAAELDACRARVLEDPEGWVGQEPGAGATTPALVDGALAPREAVTRCFVAAAEKDFHVMPGGFTRVTAPGEMAARLTTGLHGLCKDTWVIAAEEEKHLILWPASARQTRSALRESLPSRAAESLFGVGRHAERGEFVARLARTCLRKYGESRDYEDPADTGALDILLGALAALSTGTGEAGRTRPSGSHFIENSLIETVRDAALAGSLAHTLQRFERSALAVRERWSTDTWRIVEEIGGTLGPRGGSSLTGPAALEGVLDRVVGSLVAFTGLTGESMTHGHGWHFLLVGRRTERALNLIGLLERTILREAGEGIETPLLESLLIANESVMTHRRRYRAALDVTTALEVLVLDPTNPRALAHQLLELEAHLAALPRETADAGLGADQRALLAATTRSRLAEAEALARTGGSPDHARRALAGFLAAQRADLEALLTALDRAYFTHVQPVQQLAAVSLEAGIETDPEPPPRPREATRSGEGE